MDRKSFDGTRWTIAFGSYDGLEGYAVDQVYKVIQRSVPYVLTAGPTDKPAPADHNVLLIGTADSNPRIAALVRDGSLKIPAGRTGTTGSFAIRVFPDPANPKLKLAVLAGADAAGVLCSVRDFEHFYADPSLYRGEYYYGSWRCFVDEMPDWSHNGSPAISDRAAFKK